MYAFRRANGDVLYFDAVTAIEEMYTSTVTKHPIATGAFVSDHTIRDNKKFTLAAVLSDADFNLERPTLSGMIMGTPDKRLLEDPYDDVAGSYQINESTGFYEWRTNKQYQNNTPTRTTVQIEQTATGTWTQFLPETISQFTKNNIPTVTVTQQSKAKTAQAVRDELVSMWENKEAFTLLEYENNIVKRFWENVLFTKLSFAQDADTGLGLFPNMSLEQVVYTDIEKVPIQIRKVNNKGRKSGTTTKTDTVEGDDAQNEPTAKSKQSALNRLTTNAAANSAAQGQ